MADVSKRRSSFIFNVPPSTSPSALETFLRKELESSRQDRSHLLKVIFPVSTSSPGLALAIFQDEKAMVALMRKRLIFEDQHLTMQAFLAEVYSSMTAVINPDVMELFPFNSVDFSRLLEKQSGVECHKLDGRDRDRFVHPSQSRSSQEMYALTGSWYQLQNARKFMQEWVVDETNRSGFVDDGSRSKDERMLKVALSNDNSATPQQKDATERKDRTQGTVPDLEQTTGLRNGRDHHNGTQNPEDAISGLSFDGHSADREASTYTERGGGNLVNGNGRSGSRTGRRDDAKQEGKAPKVARSFDRNSLNPDSSFLEEYSLLLDAGDAGLKMMHHNQLDSSSHSTPKDGAIPKANPASQSLMHHQEPSGDPHPTSQTTGDSGRQQDGPIPPPPDEEIASEAAMHRDSDMEQRSAAPLPDQRNEDDYFGGESIPFISTGATAFSTVSRERSDDELTVGSSLDYMKHVKVPQTPLVSLDSEMHGPERSGDDLPDTGRTNGGRDGEDRYDLSHRSDLETDFAEPPPSDSTITENRTIHSDGGEVMEGLGSLPVDPGVFSYILLKQSDSIRELEERFGVKFSMHATRDNEDSDVESALLKIIPSGPISEVAQSHDAFVDLYSHIFSILHHRVVVADSTAIDSDSLDKTVDVIHRLYETVLVTVSHGKVRIYGPNESDVRLAKAYVTEALKEQRVDVSNQPEMSEVRRHSGEHSSARGRDELPSVQPDPRVRPHQDHTEVDRPPEHSFTRGEINGSPGGHIIPQTQTNTREHDPQPSSEDRLVGLPSDDLEVDSGPQTQVDGLGLEHASTSRMLNGPSTQTQDKVLESQQLEGLKGPNNPVHGQGTSFNAGTIPPPSTNEVRPEDSRMANEVTEPERRNLSDETGSLTEVIPVDPGVFAYIQYQKHSILCDIEQNYGVKFSNQEGLESDVYMVQMQPARAISEMAAGKEAFVNFYSEVFRGLEHRVISLGDFERVSQDELAEIIQEMEGLYSDLFFRVVGLRVLIYGPGRHNVETAKDLILHRLRRSLVSPQEHSVLHHNLLNESTESLSSESMVNRLNHLRYGSLSPEALRAGQTLASSLRADVPAVNGEPLPERMNQNSEDHILNEDGLPGRSSPQHLLPSPGQEQRVIRRDNQPEPQALNGNTIFSELPNDDKSSSFRTTLDTSLYGQNGTLTFKEEDKDLNGNGGNVTYRFQDDRLIFDLSSGICVQVYWQDITMIHTDAIVSAANEQLLNNGGVAGAVNRAAGEIMQADCNRYIARHGLLYPAKVIHTGPGRLPCKFVLHAVGPRWWEYPNKEQCRQTLRATVIKCLRTADEKLQVTSLAMPLISSGIFGVPVNVCIEEICEALLDFNRRRLASPHGILQRVHIVDVDDATIRQAQDVMIKALCSRHQEPEIGLEMEEADGGDSFSEPEASRGDAPLISEDRDTRRRIQREQWGASARPHASQRMESTSSDEDMPHDNVRHAGVREYNFTPSRFPMARSTSLPFLPRDDDDLAGSTRWAYSTAAASRDSGLAKKPSHIGERARASAPSSRTLKVPSKETRQEEKIRRLLDTYTKGPPSPELSRRTQFEIDRILTEQETGRRERQPKPKRRAQSLDRSRPREKCFVCTSPRNLSKRKSCEHLICETCKLARLDVGRCRECSKVKSQQEKKCDLCLCTTQNLLLNCRGCENSVCINCIKRGLDTCRDCMERMRPLADKSAEKKQPKLRESIVGARASRVDTKRDYRIKTSGHDSASTRRKPMLGLNQPLDVVAQSYSSSFGGNGSVVQKANVRPSAFSKEFVSEEAPHEQILRRLPRDVRPQTIPKDPTSSQTSTVSSLQTKTRHSRKQASKSDELVVVGKPPPPSLRSEQTTCVICMDKMKNPKTLSKCNHTFCAECIEKSLGFKPVCPICGMSYGKLQGNQPAGTMNYATVSKDLPGYPGCGTIIITYTFSDGIQSAEHPNPGVMYRGTHREAYLPNSREGQEVLKLLRRAFDARLLFTIGRSVTTGQDNTVVWNDVHHKTRETGGPERHGYPDPNYLQRVREELLAKGIK